MFLDLKRIALNPKFDTWMQYDSIVKSWIYSSVSACMNTILIGSSTSRQQWLALEE